MTTTFPKIKGVQWLNPLYPDLIAIKVTLVDRTIESLDIPGMEVPETQVDQLIDLSKLAGARDWYPKGSDLPLEDSCLIDIDGIAEFVADISKENLLKAWLFHKNFDRDDS